MNSVLFGVGVGVQAHGRGSAKDRARAGGKVSKSLKRSGMVTDGKLDFWVVLDHSKIYEVRGCQRGEYV